MRVALSLWGLEQRAQGILERGGEGVFRACQRCARLQVYLNSGGEIEVADGLDDITGIAGKDHFKRQRRNDVATATKIDGFALDGEFGSDWRGIWRRVCISLIKAQRDQQGVRI